MPVKCKYYKEAILNSQLQFYHLFTEKNEFCLIRHNFENKQNTATKLS